MWVGGLFFCFIFLFFGFAFGLLLVYPVYIKASLGCLFGIYPSIYIYIYIYMCIFDKFYFSSYINCLILSKAPKGACNGVFWLGRWQCGCGLGWRECGWDAFTLVIH